MELKTGARLKSAVCDAEIMIIAAPPAASVLTCGGVAMGGEGGAIDADHALGVVMGKRYVDEAETIEVLCIKPGEGSLALDGATLLLKDTKKLPKSD